MVWIDTIENSSPLLANEDILQAIDILHTSIIALLTPRSIILIHQQTLLPLTVHTRSEESIKQHGLNKEIKTKEINVNYGELQKLNIANLFCQTDEDYLIIFQITIDPTKSIYEVHDNNSTNNNEILQKIYPTSYSKSKFSIQNIFNNVKNLINEVTLNLENVENFNNYQQEEDKLNGDIEFTKMSIFKIIKVAIGIENVWVKSNSHNIFVYNNNCIQIINIKNMNNEVIYLNELEWYNGKQIKFIDYCKGGFVFVNESDEIWWLNVTDLPDISGYQFEGTFKDVEYIKFNPVFDLLIIYQKKRGEDLENDEILHNNVLNLYKHEKERLVFLQKIEYDLGNFQYLTIDWCFNGNFFVLLSDKGYWTIISKFGNGTTNTLNISNELNYNFLLTDKVLIGSNGHFLYLINNETKMISKVGLTSLNNDEDLVLVNQNYISTIHNNKIVKFPMLPVFKKVLNVMEDKQCKFKVSINDTNQFIMTFGNQISVSTPFREGTINPLRHIVWYHFKNYYMESLNIIQHICYKNYILLINRSMKEINNKDKLIDELIIINIEDLKYGDGGSQIHFDSDLIVWRQKFNNLILTVDIINGNLAVLEDTNFKILLFKISRNTKINENFYKFHIKVIKTIYLNDIPGDFDVSKVIKLDIINANNDIIFLLNNGDFFLLKSQSNKILLTNFYQLIKINESIENFKINNIILSEDLVKYIYLFKGNSILIYNLTNLIDLSFDKSIHITDGIEDIDLPSLIQPIIVNYTSYQPLKILQNDKTINLIGLQDLIINNNIVKLKLNYNLILNNLIEFDLINNIPLDDIKLKFNTFENFSYCLELLLFKYLTNDDTELLKKLVKLIDNDLIIFINCLRKIEFNYWSKFFKVLGKTPITMMENILHENNVELCYNFLIIYLNCKKEGEINGELDKDDKLIIMKILKLLDSENRWDWCFELCRFVKLLDPSSEFLKAVEIEIFK
ncbi:hypothetical protein CLIB1444_17S00914 [[Candida] jaroonii]|uniref:Uncharacterized protein n=1 Tax=[Candida] jaroonii TaxID=467808 RepID=A0ACA9YFC7_9ASCO|nr:hypothetical protein CLIB1444_17S00914 [[Candida] jaroonii]